MEKLKQFFKEKYKILIPIIVVLVLLITMYFLYREYRYDNYRNKKEVAVYQWFGGLRYDYTGIITYNLDEVIVGIASKDKKIEYDSTPVYYKEKDRVIFPEEMTLVYPLKDGSQYRVYKYSVYESDVGLHFLTNEKVRDEYTNFFLFDGSNLYFFPDSVTLYVDGKEYRKLGAMSYVKVVGGYTMEYYDKEKDESDVLEVEGKQVTVKNDYMEVNLTRHHVVSFGKKITLFKPYNLNGLTD